MQAAPADASLRLSVTSRQAYLTPLWFSTIQFCLHRCLPQNLLYRVAGVPQGLLCQVAGICVSGLAFHLDRVFPVLHLRGCLSDCIADLTCQSKEFVKRQKVSKHMYVNNCCVSSCLYLFRVAGLAPASRRILATSMHPLRHAQCKGVLPSEFAISTVCEHYV